MFNERDESKMSDLKSLRKKRKCLSLIYLLFKEICEPSLPLQMNENLAWGWALFSQFKLSDRPKVGRIQVKSDPFCFYRATLSSCLSALTTTKGQLSGWMNVKLPTDRHRQKSGSSTKTSTSLDHISSA